MRKSVIFWVWAALLTIILVIASQPVGLSAQFTFGMVGVGVLLLIRLLKLRGAWMHVFMAIAAAIVFRYMYWRLTSTIPPISDPINFTFGFMLFIAEVYSVGMLVISFFIVADPLERKDAPLIGEEFQWPTVDIFVPSYNEDLDLVGMTLAAAKNLDYPANKVNVFLLDDGGTDEKCNDSNPEKAKSARNRRIEMQEFCDELGVQYLTRARNEHAKAGNLNSALERSCGDLIVIFDADHAPTRDFLKYTVGHFQRDPKLFLVQTPHFFLNPDPVEKNLETFKRMPSENEMFYTIIQKGLDKWNGTFFCGSAAVLSREALQLTNGFSGESITEDCETALELHTRGWNSMYVDRAMIAGLQPETFVTFIGQRSRWCQGMLQILLLKKPMFRKGLSFSQRLAYTSSPLFWMFPLSRLTFMFAPALFVFFDLQIYNASLQEFFAYTTFFLISNILVQNQIYGSVRWPWISELYEYVQSLYLAKSIACVIANPRKPSFNVTDKGGTLEKGHLSALAWPYFLMFGFLAATTGWALWRIAFEGTANELLVIVTMWSLFNLAIAGVALGVVSERRERRRNYRMDTERRGDLILNEVTYPVLINDCSTSGMCLRALDGLIPFSTAEKEFERAILNLHAGTDAKSGYPLNVVLNRSSSDDQGPTYGVEYKDLTALDRRAIATLMYPNNSALETIRMKRHTGRAVTAGSMEFLYWSVHHTVRGFSYFAKSFRESEEKEAPTRPVVDAPALAAEPNKAPIAGVAFAPQGMGQNAIVAKPYDA